MSSYQDLHRIVVSAALYNCMQSSLNQSDSEHPGVVFVLGAGCSMQYGLPSFRELLFGLYRELLPYDPEENSTTDELRNTLDVLWRKTNPSDRQSLLKRFLGSVADPCIGYRYLARLAKLKLVKAIVNMNFDTLLEKALEEEGIKIKDPSEEEIGVRTEEGVSIITPHGTLAKRKKREPLILDIAESNLFTDPELEKEINNLLSGHDVAIIGYSGCDAKIVHSLYTAEEGRQSPSEDSSPIHRLFTINVTPPSPLLIYSISKRRSEELYLTGPYATFEMITSQLYRHMEAAQTGKRQRRPDQPDNPPSTFSPEEEISLEQYKKLALRLRSRMNVAEASYLTLEEHGRNLYQRCLDIARSLGIPLNSPERYIIHCAAYLHDLGYFQAYSNESKTEKGFQLLERHGKITASILETYFSFNPSEKDRIRPSTYSEETGELLVDMIVSLCRYHSLPILPESDPILDRIKNSVIRVDGFIFKIRFDLVHAIFVTAEEILDGHPFTLSPYPIEEERREELGQRTVDDPILDLYLRGCLESHLAASRFTISRIMASLIIASLVAVKTS